MPLSSDTKKTAITIAKFSLIGMAAAFVVLYFSQSEESGNKTVEFKQVDSKANPGTVADGKQITVSYAAAVQAAAPAVVNIYTSKAVKEQNQDMMDDPLFRYFFGDQLPQQRPQQRPETSLGSGVVVSTDGYILTNNHVIEQAREIEVALRDGRTASAKIVGTDPESDLAVLKIVLPNLPAITLGNSDNMQIGDVVLAIGNPFGVGQTVTMGIVSATGRDKLGLHTFEDFIQTDAAINPGNSGGALVNAYGHLVGINTAIFSRSGGSQGIGFAIPVDNVKTVTQEIIEHGHMVRGWLGIEIQNLTADLAESFGMDNTRGVIIAGVLNRGPADQAGLKPGDVIIAINGKGFDDGKQALNQIANAKPGTKIELTILRQGKQLAMSAVTDERPVPKK